MSKIFNELWEIDQAHNGMTVNSRMVSRGFDNLDADILIDEQNRYTYNVDKAPNPLFVDVKDEKLNGKTYQAFIQLLDNYLINPNDREDDLEDNPVEYSEIKFFIDLIVETPVMIRALKYINDELNHSMDSEEFKEELIKIWFDLFDNFYGGKETKYCSGFEHVFVGEGKKRGSGIGGYHYWLKFFRDESSGRVDFKGFNYGSNETNKTGSRNPDVVTLAMEWETNDSNNRIRIKSKDKGGFFVGPSPEGQIAMATVLYYKSLKNPNDFEKGTHYSCVINEHEYKLVMYRESTKDGGNNAGHHIRSFFPVYIKPSNGSNDGKLILGTDKIKITKALINPRGSEWIELANVTETTVHLNGWTVKNKEHESFELHGDIQPNKTLKIYFNPKSFKLTNDDGFINVLDSRGTLVTGAEYNKPKRDEVLYFV